MFTSDIFRLADLCIDAGYYPGLEDLRYIVLLRSSGRDRAEIRRADPDEALPSPCRVWLVKGPLCKLLGDSAALPADLSAEVRPPFLG